MSYIHPDVLDDGLQVLTDDANVLHILDTEPATYANIASYTLGNKATPAVSAPGAGDPNGREVEVSAINDGTVTGTDDAAYWCLADTVGERLLAAGALSSSQSVTSGNTFTLTAFTIRMPNPS